MARKRGKKFIADGIDSHGKRRRIAFRTEEMAEEYKAKVLNAGYQMTVGHLFPKWSEEIWTGTKAEYNALGLSKLVIKALGPTLPITEITRATIKKLSDDWLAGGNTQATVNRKLSCLSKLLDHAVEEEILEDRPKITLKGQADSRRFRVLSYEEEDTLLRSFRYDVDRLFTGFLIDTGCRYSETERLEWRDLSHNERRIMVWKSKTGKPRPIPLTDRAFDALMWSKKEGFQRPWEALTYRAFMQRWHLAREAAELDEECIPYVCRHTCATRLALGGMDVFRLMKWMGHSNIATTQRYIQLNPADLDEGVSILARRTA